uniref:Inosine/uridine-preferring nucleoside hydrolase domain-containing protein n=1 Tax=Rhizophora mucronata TaxID=61149 RepID=A0A2P2MZQ9_RHIMU
MGHSKGNPFMVHPNEHTELNMFLDPLAVKTVFESSLDITLIPLGAQRSVSSFSEILQRLENASKTPEALFAHRLLSRIDDLQKVHHRYRHMDTFLGEILGAVVLANDQTTLKTTFQSKPIKVIADGVESRDGLILIDRKHGKTVKILQNVDSAAYYDLFANQLGVKEQSAVIGSFDEQRRVWSMPTNETEKTSQLI